jgi:hypothetical protein
VVTLAFEGDSRIVDMTNGNAMVLGENSAGDWELQAFELGYVDPESGAWASSFGPMSFQAEPRGSADLARESR